MTEEKQKKLTGQPDVVQHSESQPDSSIQVDVQQTEDLISRANTAAARQEAANAELARLLAKQERMQVEKTFGGKADVLPAKKELTPTEYVKKIMSGDF